MPVKTTHFKVGNGDMTLIEFESGKRLLVDVKIRLAADDSDDETPDVGAQLRERLDRDASKRKFVDAFLLTHPDQDHCSGLRNHFHLGPLKDWNEKDDRIVIREMWSSPLIFRRAEKKSPLCDDAKAWNTEARRRVKVFETKGALEDGDRILILGEDIDGKTDKLGTIVMKAGSRFSKICGKADTSFESLLLGPMLAADDEEDEQLSKNDSSVVMQLSLLVGSKVAARYLLGGDAEVAIWEKVRDAYADDDLKYDVLLAPHHCSWHSLSWDSWSEKGEKAEVSKKARSALAQAEAGAMIISSSCVIEDDDNDPPCIRAEREYKEIVKKVAGEFRCLADDQGDQPLEITVTQYGPKAGRRKAAAVAGLSTGVGTEALGHG